MFKESVKVGIIGGTGQMGKLFRRFFEKNNCEVLVSSRKTNLKPKDCARQSDVVMVSVPIDVTVSVIKKIGSYINKNSLLIDTTSIKKEPVKTMLQYAKCEVIGMHPMFGPNVSSFKNQTIILCPARTKRWLKWIIEIFEKNDAKIKIITPEKHDKIMSIIQGLNHFSTLTVAHAMKSLGKNFEEIKEYTSQIYNLRMMMIARILNQDHGLYANIEIKNPNNKRTITVYLNSAKKLQKIIEEKNSKAFVRYFKESAEYFKNFKKDAERVTDYLIEQMVKRK